MINKKPEKCLFIEFHAPFFPDFILASQKICSTPGRNTGRVPCAIRTVCAPTTMWPQLLTKNRVRLRTTVFWKLIEHAKKSITYKHICRTCKGVSLQHMQGRGTSLDFLANLKSFMLSSMLHTMRLRKMIYQQNPTSNLEKTTLKHPADWERTTSQRYQRYAQFPH